MYRSKIDIQKALRDEGPIVLDVGCGNRKFQPASIGIDITDHPAVDIVGDIFDVLRDLPPDCISQIQARHFLEHIDDVEGFLVECRRVLKVNGLITISVPHFSSSYFYSDPTHRRFFGLYSLSYLVESDLFKRSVPSYAQSTKSGLHLERVSLNFKAPREFPISYGILRVIGLFVDFNRATQEFYERWMTGLIPCYEVAYDIRKTDIQDGPN